MADTKTPSLDNLTDEQLNFAIVKLLPGWHEFSPANSEWPLGKRCIYCESRLEVGKHWNKQYLPHASDDLSLLIQIIESLELPVRFLYLHPAKKWVAGCGFSGRQFYIIEEQSLSLVLTKLILKWTGRYE